MNDEYTIKQLCEHFSEHSKRYEKYNEKHSLDFPEADNSSYFNLPKALLKICEEIQKMQKI